VRLANFGTLCDRLGQAVGELVLKDVAHALARHVDDVDTVAYIDGSTFGCLLFGRDDKEVGHLCREVAAEVATLSRRRGAVAELRAGNARLGLDPSPVAAWQAAGERLADPQPSP
jgi:GGDEF domain-containing protein